MFADKKVIICVLCFMQFVVYSIRIPFVYRIPVVYRILKDFALELAPLVCDIYNQSVREGYIPAHLKSSIVTPIPKVSPPALIEQDLTPISLACTLAKVMEGFTCSRLLPQLEGKIDPCQFSRKGHSTTDALTYMLQAIYEAVDSGEVSARIFFADFSKELI